MRKFFVFLKSIFNVKKLPNYQFYYKIFIVIIYSNIIQKSFANVFFVFQKKINLLKVKN